MLPMAVHLRMLDTPERTWELADIRERLEAFGSKLGSEGDKLLFRSKKEGETAEMFNELAWAIHMMSYCPGGIKAFGHHFESFPSYDGYVPEHWTSEP